MLKTRVIPSLLINQVGLIKGRMFKDHKYVGDPINAVKIFNEKEVDELIFLDVSATKENRIPNFELISDIAGEAFMPLGYGGGISSVSQTEKLFSIGIEKAIINTAAFYTPSLIKDAASVSGSQSIVVSIDVKKSIFGKYDVFIQSGQINTKENPVDFAKKMQDFNAGELIICSIDREGTARGYDLDLLEAISNAVEIPVVGSGGAGCLNDLVIAKNNTAVSGLAAGDLFLFHGKHKAVLISYPSALELKSLFN